MPSPFANIPPEWLERFLGQGAPAPDPAYDEARAADAEAQRRSDLQSAFSQAGALVRNQPVAAQPFKSVGDENLRAWVAKKGADYRAQDPYRDLFMLGVRGEQDAAAKAEAARVRGEEKGEERTYQEGRDERQNAAAMERAKVAAGSAAASRSDKKDAAGVKNAMDLRKEFQSDPIVKSTKDVHQAIAKIREVPEDGTGDLSLIYSYVKILDPGSVVREGEIALAGKPTPLLQKLQMQYKRLAAGDLLAPELRASYKNAAEKLWQAQMGSYQSVADEYGRLANQFGIDPSTVVLDLGFKAGGRAGGAAPGSPSGQRRPRRTVGNETREWDGQAWVPVAGGP
jgi:hypothetical protein